jgi:outer membrane protein TolC
VQQNVLANTQYNLNGYASAYYIELLREYELQTVEQNNVTRLQQLKTLIDTLVRNGIRSGIDSAVTSAELAKSVIALYQAQTTLAQTRVQLNYLTGLSLQQLLPDTNIEKKVNTDGLALALTATTVFRRRCLGARFKPGQ